MVVGLKIRKVDCLVVSKLEIGRSVKRRTTEESRTRTSHLCGLDLVIRLEDSGAVNDSAASRVIPRRLWLYIANTLGNTSRLSPVPRGADTKTSRYNSVCTPTAQRSVVVSSCSNYHWSIVLSPRRLSVYGSRCLARNIPARLTDLDKA